MRVALLAWDYPPAPSGLSTAAREIAESLAGEGADVTVFTLDRTGQSRAGGVAVEGLALPPGGGLARLRLWGSLGHLAAPAAFRRRSWRRMRARRSISSRRRTGTPRAVLLAGRRDLPLVREARRPPPSPAGPSRTCADRLDGLAADALERRQARGSAGLIANTQAHGAVIARAYRLTGRQPSAVIGLSLPPNIFGVLAARLIRRRTRRAPALRRPGGTPKGLRRTHRGNRDPRRRDRRAAPCRRSASTSSACPPPTCRRTCPRPRASASTPAAGSTRRLWPGLHAGPRGVGALALRELRPRLSGGPGLWPPGRRLRRGRERPRLRRHARSRPARRRRHRDGARRRPAPRCWPIPACATPTGLARSPPPGGSTGRASDGRRLRCTRRPGRGDRLCRSHQGFARPHQRSRPLGSGTQSR